MYARYSTALTFTLVLSAYAVSAQTAESVVDAPELVQEDVAETALGTTEVLDVTSPTIEATKNSTTGEIIVPSVEQAEEDASRLEEIAAADPAFKLRANEEGQEDAMVMLSDVLFSFNDASLEPAALDVLRQVAEKLDGVGAIEITGHTDDVGDAAYNLALGEQRASAVRTWLIENTALTAEIVTARGIGEEDPIAENVNGDGSDNPEGRAANRRVEFTLPNES